MLRPTRMDCGVRRRLELGKANQKIRCDVCKHVRAVVDLRVLEELYYASLEFVKALHARYM
jgi:hypothetical protein